MATNSGKRWIVRDAEGKIFGPFTTEQVHEQIDRNYFLGAEHVASYPGGDWKPISRTAEFSDRLLDVLAAEVEQAPKPRPKQNDSSRSAKSTDQDDEPTITNSENGFVQPQEASKFEPSQAGPSVTYGSALARPQNTRTGSSKTENSPVIELTDLKALARVKKIEVTRKPLIMIAVIVLLAGLGIWFSDDSGTSGNRIRLLVPRSGQAEIGADRRKEKFTRALLAFQKDTFEGYQRAQDELVETIEGTQVAGNLAKVKAEYYSYLCLAYRELWPFTFQDEKDMRAITQAVQEAKRMDPGGVNGAVCEVVQLYLTSKIRESQSLLESVILERTPPPALFEIRGDMYLAARDYTSAANYFSQVQSLWPGWQKGFVQEARANAEAGKYPPAMQAYQKVLARVPEHGVAKVELGLIEGIQFKQLDKGLSLISSGVQETIPRTIASNGYLGIAKIYIEKKQNDRALTAAKKSYAMNPGNKEAKDLIVLLGGEGADREVKPGETDLMFLGEQYLRSGDFFAAQAQFKAAFEANPKNGMAAMKAGQSLWQLHQTADAIDWMKRAIRVDSQLITAYVELADYYAQRFDYFAAAEMLKEAQRQQPNNFEVYRGFATVELRRNNFKGAVGFGERALKLYETDVPTLLILAKAHRGAGNFQDAQKFATRAIELDYNNIEAQSTYAKVEAGLHGVESGASYIQQMLNRYVIIKGQQIPQAAIDYRVTLGEIFMQDERYQQAEDVFRQALSLDQNNKSALIGLGKSLQAQSMIAQALEAFLKAAVMDPSDADPIFYSGELYSQIDRRKEATLQFERVLKINPRYPKAHAALGRVALRAGEYQKAIEEAAQERGINPDLADSYLLAAEAYFGLKQYSNCAGEYQKAVQKRANTASTYVRMARCYRLSGAIESAQSLLKQATTIESGNPDIYKEQGAVFHTKGMADEAIGAYDTYLRLVPNASDRAEVEALIRKVQSGDMQLSN